jgi:hypothetical protein
MQNMPNPYNVRASRVNVKEKKKKQEEHEIIMPLTQIAAFHALVSLKCNPTKVSIYNAQCLFVIALSFYNRSISLALDDTTATHLTIA